VTDTPVNWRDLPPIPVAEREPALARLSTNRAPSVTFLGKHDTCDRSAFLYEKHRGGPPTHQLARGSVFHEVVADLTNELAERGEHEIPPELAKDRLLEVLERQLELTPSAYERDQLRGMLYNWSVGSYFWPERIIGVELDLDLKLGDWTIRGRVDLVEQADDWTLDITDYKTQWDMPRSSEDAEWAQGGRDENGNPRFGGTFETEVYALLAAFGTTPDGSRIGDGVERFRVFLRFPRYLREEGLAYRAAEIDRKQLVDFRFDVESQLRRLQRQLETGKWQPTPGSQCGRCPAEYECPLPRHLRPESQLAGPDVTVEDLEQAATSHYFMQRRTTQLKSRIRKAADRLGLSMVRIGAGDGDLALVFQHRDSEKITNKEKLRTDVEGAVEYGHPFKWEDHVTYSQWTEFDKRKVGRPDDNDDQEVTSGSDDQG
jgi:RecB family exonuclease